MAWVAVAVACTPTAARSQTVENASYRTSDGEPDGWSLGMLYKHFAEGGI
jgi:hypothetical protein